LFSRALVLCSLWLVFCCSLIATTHHHHPPPPLTTRLNTTQPPAAPAGLHMTHISSSSYDTCILLLNHQLLQPDYI
jgi:hypothetical protein